MGPIYGIPVLSLTMISLSTLFKLQIERILANLGSYPIHAPGPKKPNLHVQEIPQKSQ